MHRVGDTVYVDSSLGASALRVVDRFPVAEEEAAAGFAARAAAGERGAGRGRRRRRSVAAGDVLVMLEAMKMEHTIRALRTTAWSPSSAVAVGDQVETGAVLVVLAERDDASERA